MPLKHVGHSGPWLRGAAMSVTEHTGLRILTSWTWFSVEPQYTSILFSKNNTWFELLRHTVSVQAYSTASSWHFLLLTPCTPVVTGWAHCWVFAEVPNFGCNPLVFIHFSFFWVFLVRVFVLVNELLIIFILVFVHENNTAVVYSIIYYKWPKCYFRVKLTSATEVFFAHTGAIQVRLLLLLLYNNNNKIIIIVRLLLLLLYNNNNNNNLTCIAPVCAKETSLALVSFTQIESQQTISNLLKVSKWSEYLLLISYLY